jgi:ABC-type multidrug transport system permease subunit
MIPSENIPTFWIFLYWLNPLHYTLEGLFMTQFNDDNTAITLITGGVTNAQAYVANAFSEWSYAHRYGDAVALVIFIMCLR